MLRDAKKTLDNVEVGPYATASMSSPLSPEMLNRGSSVHAWTERGDLENAGQEEGSEEGDQEEEVRAPGCGLKGGWTDHPPVHF